MIAEIWTAYGEVYERGDGALDRLCEFPAYARWLDEGMTEEYLAQASAFELEMILADIKTVAVDYA